MRRAGATVLLGFLLAGLSGCSGGQMSLRDGLLRPDIGQKAFRSEWGEPDQILPVLSEQIISQRWGQPMEMLRNVDPDDQPELWIYERYGTELLFLDGDLIAWKTKLTREQLKKIPRGEVP